MRAKYIAYWSYTVGHSWPFAPGDEGLADGSEIIQVPVGVRYDRKRRELLVGGRQSYKSAVLEVLQVILGKEGSWGADTRGGPREGGRIRCHVRRVSPSVWRSGLRALRVQAHRVEAVRRFRRLMS